MAKVLTQNQEVYERLVKRKSRKGFSFRSAIQVGIDHPEGAFDHKNDVARVGFVVGDEFCYKEFSLFLNFLTPVLHADYREDGIHWTSFNYQEGDIEDDLDMWYVTEIRIETSRNFKGISMPVTMSREERRLVERIIVHCLGFLEHKKIEFEVKGTYTQYSYFDNLDHMRGHLDESGIKCMYFPVEDRIVYKKSGLLRDWPDARGYWINSERTVMCNVNEVDHLMITSLERSPKLKKIFTNHRLVLEVFQERIEEFAQASYAHDPHYGFLTTSPGIVGTATHIFVNLKLKAVTKNVKVFTRFLRKHRLGYQEVNATTVSVYNLFTLGFSEGELANVVYEGVKKLIELDKFLVAWPSSDWIENERTLPFKKIGHLMHCDWSWYAPQLIEEGDDAAGDISAEELRLSFL